MWDLNNRVTQAVGGPDCLWLGMNSGNIHHQALRFRDHKAILERSKIVMLDHQRRGKWGFQQNGDAGKLAHGVAGWDVIMPESMAQYQNGVPTFRLGAKPAARSAPLDDRGLCRGHPTVVALYQRLSRGPPPISHVGRAHALVRRATRTR